MVLGVQIRPLAHFLFFLWCHWSCREICNKFFLFSKKFPDHQVDRLFGTWLRASPRRAQNTSGARWLQQIKPIDDVEQKTAMLEAGKGETCEGSGGASGGINEGIRTDGLDGS